jgi:hypothetical protein
VKNNRGKGGKEMEKLYVTLALTLALAMTMTMAIPVAAGPAPVVVGGAAGEAMINPFWDWFLTPDYMNNENIEAYLYWILNDAAGVRPQLGFPCYTTH